MGLSKIENNFFDFSTGTELQAVFNALSNLEGGSDEDAEEAEEDDSSESDTMLAQIQSRVEENEKITRETKYKAEFNLNKT